MHYVFEVVDQNGTLFRYICRGWKNAVWYIRRLKQLPKIKRNIYDRRFVNAGL